MIDKEFQAEIRKLPCLACGASPPSECHHVKHRGSGGGDDFWNLMPLCFRHHSEWHQIGMEKMIDKYPTIKEFLTKLGWEWGETLGKWKAWHP